MYMTVLFLCMYVYYMYAGTLRGQKRAPDLLELELSMVEIHHVGTGNGTQVLCNSNRFS